MEAIYDLSFTITGRIQLDMSRAQEDPWFEQFTRGLNLDNPEELEQALQAYVSAYLTRERIFSTNAPWTCGPADIYTGKIEVINGRNTSGRQEATESGTPELHTNVLR
jgi:hypothetical protein